MPARRTILAIAALGLCTVGLAWIGTSAPASRIALAGIDVEQPYAIQVTFERARFDLDFDQHARYLLIVGSLSNDHRPHRVTLSAESTTETVPLPASPIVPLVKPTIASRPRIERSDAYQTQRQSVRKVQPVRHFHLHVTDGALDDPRHYTRVAARLVGEGREVRVYLDMQQKPAELTPGLVDRVVQLLDDKLLPAFRQQVGGIRDVDGDGKFAVLLSPWLGRLQGGKTSLGGFVRESDFRTDIAAPFSNRCDMMYLNSNLTPGPHLQTLLAHELMHAVTFSARLPSAAQPRGLPDEEDWLNEAIAHLSENLNGDGWSNLDYRISRYLSQSQQYPLVVDDYYHAGLWRNHGCRGATYLFLRWCVDQFGADLLKELIHAPGRGRDNLRHVTGIEFDELFRRWTVSLYLSNQTTPDSEAKKSAVARFDRYQAIDLRGQIGNWGLAGPRPVKWNIEGEPCQLQLAGTSAAFVLLESPAAAGKQRIRVTGEFGAKLQVTLLKLPSDLPTISPVTGWDSEPVAPSSAPTFHMEFSEVALARFDIECISFEQNWGETKETHRYSGQALTGCRVGDCDEMPLRFDFPIRGEAQSWLCKVVAKDKRGRRICAFIDVPSAKRRSAIRFAAGQQPTRTSR